LPRPQWREATITHLFSGRTQRSQRTAGMGEVRCQIRERARLPHQPVDYPSRRAAAEHLGQGSVLALGRMNRGAMQGRGRRLMTAEEGSSHLDGAGAQRQGGPDTFAIDYATGGDDGQLYRRDYLWQQGKGTL